jgi:hypothetical protein
MELSTLFIIVVFMIPFALGLILLGAMATDGLPAATVTKKSAAKAPATKDSRMDSIGYYLPA